MTRFSKIRDHIAKSTIVVTPPFILPEEITLLQTGTQTDVMSLITDIRLLPHHSDVTLDVIDLDDTAYTRVHTLQDPMLMDNRGSAGNQVIQERPGGYNGFVDRFYSTSGVVRDMLEVLLSKESLLLTAGDMELQRLKCRALRIDMTQVPIQVVESASQKP